MVGCKTTPTYTKQDFYPSIYNEKPISLLIVPIINNTTAADAGELYFTTLIPILSEAGYYVLPIAYTRDVMRQQGIIDGITAKDVSFDKYKALFGADAVLFITVNSWDTNYVVVSSNMTVSASFDLYSTKTSDMLWQYDDKIVHKLTGDSGNPIIDVIVTALATALTDYIPIAKAVNQKIVNTLPKGVYHSKHDKDQKEILIGGRVRVPTGNSKVTEQAKLFIKPTDDKANIYIYRAEPISKSSKRTIWLDEKCIGDTANGTFMQLTVEAGKEYKITTESEFSPNDFRLTPEKGTNYFIEQTFSIGWAAQVSNLNLIENEIAKAAMKDSKIALQGMCGKTYLEATK